MYYFVNQYLLTRNSSVEHMEIKRAHLFRQFEQPAKIVTFNYDRVQQKTLDRFNLDQDQVVNMFDFFRDTTDYVGHILKIDDFDVPNEYEVSNGNNERTIKNGDLLIGKIHFTVGTVAQINHVDYFDRAGNLTLTTQYDIRGFKATDQFYGADGNLFNEILYKPNGERFMERSYVASTKHTAINSLNRLINYRGKDWYFNEMNELKQFFLEELDQSTDGQNAFIADRPAEANEAVLNMQTKAKKYLFVPFNHLQNPTKPEGPINGLYQFPFSTEGQNRFDGVIVMTEAQKQLLKMQYPQLPVTVISAAIAEPVEQQVPMADRNQHSLIYVGRLDFDKGIDKLLQIFKQVHEQVKDATLQLWGYGPSEKVEQFEQQLADLKLDEPGLVEFKGYEPELNDMYDHAQLLLDAGKVDGQPLSMMEALSHGVPVVSFDYPFGPAEMIKDGQNGYLVKGGNSAEFVQRTVELLKDKKKLQAFSDQAYKSSKQFSPAKVWKQWQNLK